MIVDSASVCAGVGLLAIAAANAVQAGADAQAAAARARAVRAELKILFAVDTLEFLRRGGRIGGAQAWIGSTLKIKPILAIESEIVPVERVRTWGRAFERMVTHLRTLREEGNDRFFVQHIQAADQAEKLAQRGEAIYGRPPEFVLGDGPRDRHSRGPGADRCDGAARRAARPRLTPARRPRAGARRRGAKRSPWRPSRHPLPARRSRSRRFRSG